MYKYNGYIPRVRCLCGREMNLIRATVCECGVTMRFRHVPKQHRFLQPIALPPDSYDLANRPVKVPEVVEWVEVGG